KEGKESGRTATATSDVVGGGNLTVKHFYNFAESIRGKEKPSAPMAEARKSDLLCHLGNIAQATGHTLNLNPADGKIKNDREAMKYWKREYERGWKPKI